MVESVMRQGMETWLDKKCVSIGRIMFNTARIAEGIETELQVVASPQMKVGYMQFRLKPTSDMIDAIYEGGIINEWEHGDLKRRLHNVEEHLPEEFPPELSGRERRRALAVSAGDAADLIDKLKFIMFEKVVECQRGESGG